MDDMIINADWAGEQVTVHVSGGNIRSIEFEISIGEAERLIDSLNRAIEGARRFRDKPPSSFYA